MPELQNAASRRRGLCLVLAAPSGAGKTTITRRLLAQDAALSLSVSATTRVPRPGEIDGVHYLFRTEAQFAAMVAAGDFLEHATVFGRAYGTPRAPVAAALTQGRDILFDIDWQGFAALRAALPNDTVGVFILPPSLAALRARLEARGDTPAEVAARLAGAEADMAHWRDFDHLVVNDDLDRTVAGIAAILFAARTETRRQLWLAPSGLALA